MWFGFGVVCLILVWFGIRFDIGVVWFWFGIGAVGLQVGYDGWMEK